MKKYTLFSLIFVLSFIFLGSFNTANAENCASGELFNTRTGERCAGLVSVVLCPSGDVFSSLTGQRCTVWEGDDSSSTVARFNSLFKPTFKVGSRGDEIKTLQQFLKDEGYYFGKVDGKYGRISARAVKDFQDDNNLYLKTQIPVPSVPEVIVPCTANSNSATCITDQKSPVIS